MCAQRIALYGGTFDPVHVGHLEIARRVSEAFEIDKLLFIPAQMAPHKIGRPVTHPIHRYAMLALATQDDPRLAISTFELDAPDRRYTVDTIEHFQRELGDSTELFFIMGADSWSEITTWREWERLLSMTNHIVVTRPGYEPSTTHVGEHKDRIVHLRGTAASIGRGFTRIYITDLVMNDVSATQVRRLASEGRTDELVNLVPGPVLEYIKKYRTYEN
ncbi:MAG TPA: nicotinate-nucleotide adenylyltransferase [Pyrinomonadaceae bacterium]|nr:nicotinate-nucleotide adenylyltransferase [Pyrinomonadaceae bacterium]